MKTMRYRIRIITLVLICALLAAALWTARSAWFPDGFSPETPAESAPSVSPEASSESASPAAPDPWAEPVSVPETGSPAETTSTPDPLFNTFGL